MRWRRCLSLAAAGLVVAAGILAGSAGAAKRTPSERAMALREGLVSTSSTSQPGICAAIHATRQPTVPAPTTAIRSPMCGRASHMPLIAVSTFAASTARCGGTPSGTT